MRGNPDPAPHGEAGLNRTAIRSGIVALVLLAAAAATGGPLSPFVPLLAAALIVLIRAAPSPAVLAAAPAASFLLMFGDAVRDELTAGRALISLLLLGAVAPGFLWRRETRRAAARLARLDDLLTEADHGDGPALAGVDDRADLERGLSALAARLGVLGVTVWDVDGAADVARTRASVPMQPARQIRLTGDPLGWVWEQGIRMRIDPPPRWAPVGFVALAERLSRDENGRGAVVSYLVPIGAEAPDDAALDQAAVYVRGTLRLHEERERHSLGTQRIQLVLGRLGRISGDLTLDVFARELCETAMEIAGATGAAVGDWHEGTGTVRGVAGSDGGPRPDDTFVLPGSELALGVAAGTMIVRDAAEWSLGRTAVAAPDERWEQRPRSLAVLPLQAPAGIVGVLGVWSSRARSLDPEALRMLHLLAPYAALHLQHARAWGDLRESAERDPLTGLRNRRAFDEAFDAESRRWERYGRPLAVMVLDIDHFKSVNDTWGHEAGDDVLRRVARVVASGVRDADIPARMGGEEFVVIMPETGLAAAAEVAERIRGAVAGLEVEWQGRPIPVRLSVGVSAAPERVDHPRDLVASADAALYRAKEEGRDRVVLA